MNTKSPVEKSNIRVGDRVYIVPLRQIGIVSKIDKSGKATVSVNSLSTICHLKDLQLRTESNANHKRSSHKLTKRLAKKRPKGIIIDLHGMKSERALAMLEENINLAVINGAPYLEVIHGIGTGKIREVVYNYLQNSDLDIEIRPSPVNPGSLTVVFKP